MTQRLAVAVLTVVAVCGASAGDDAALPSDVKLDRTLMSWDASALADIPPPGALSDDHKSDRTLGLAAAYYAYRNLPSFFSRRREDTAGGLMLSRHDDRGFTRVSGGHAADQPSKRSGGGGGGGQRIRRPRPHGGGRRPGGAYPGPVQGGSHYGGPSHGVAGGVLGFGGPGPAIGAGGHGGRYPAALNGPSHYGGGGAGGHSGGGISGGHGHGSGHYAAAVQGPSHYGGGGGEGGGVVIVGGGAGGISGGHGHGGGHYAAALQGPSHYGEGGGGGGGHSGGGGVVVVGGGGVGGGGGGISGGHGHGGGRYPAAVQGPSNYGGGGGGGHGPIGGGGRGHGHGGGGGVVVGGGAGGGRGHGGGKYAAALQGPSHYGAPVHPAPVGHGHGAPRHPTPQISVAVPEFGPPKSAISLPGPVIRPGGRDEGRHSGGPSPAHPRPTGYQGSGAQHQGGGPGPVHPRPVGHPGGGRPQQNSGRPNYHIGAPQPDRPPPQFPSHPPPQIPSRPPPQFPSHPPPQFPSHPPPQFPSHPPPQFPSHPPPQFPSHPPPQFQNQFQASEPQFAPAPQFPSPAPPPHFVDLGSSPPPSHPSPPFRQPSEPQFQHVQQSLGPIRTQSEDIGSHIGHSSSLSAIREVSGPVFVQQDVVTNEIGPIREVNGPSEPQGFNRQPKFSSNLGPTNEIVAAPPSIDLGPVRDADDAPASPLLQSQTVADILGGPAYEYTQPANEPVAADSQGAPLYGSAGSAAASRVPAPQEIVLVDSDGWQPMDDGPIHVSGGVGFVGESLSDPNEVPNTFALTEDSLSDARPVPSPVGFAGQSLSDLSESRPVIQQVERLPIDVTAALNDPSASSGLYLPPTRADVSLSASAPSPAVSGVINPPIHINTGRGRDDETSASEAALLDLFGAGSSGAPAVAQVLLSVAEDDLGADDEDDEADITTSGSVTSGVVATQPVEEEEEAQKPDLVERQPEQSRVIRRRPNQATSSDSVKFSGRRRRPIGNVNVIQPRNPGVTRIPSEDTSVPASLSGLSSTVSNALANLSARMKAREQERRRGSASAAGVSIVGLSSTATTRTVLSPTTTQVFPLRVTSITSTVSVGTSSIVTSLSANSEERTSILASETSTPTLTTRVFRGSTFTITPTKTLEIAQATSTSSFVPASSLPPATFARPTPEPTSTTLSSLQSTSETLSSLQPTSATVALPQATSATLSGLQLTSATFSSLQSTPVIFGRPQPTPATFNRLQPTSATFSRPQTTSATVGFVRPTSSAFSRPLATASTFNRPRPTPTPTVFQPVTSTGWRFSHRPISWSFSSATNSDDGTLTVTRGDSQSDTTFRSEDTSALAANDVGSVATTVTNSPAPTTATGTSEASPIPTVPLQQAETTEAPASPISASPAAEIAVIPAISSLDTADNTVDSKPDWVGGFSPSAAPAREPQTSVTTSIPGITLQASVVDDDESPTVIETVSQGVTLSSVSPTATAVPSTTPAAGAGRFGSRRRFRPSASLPRFGKKDIGVFKVGVKSEKEVTAVKAQAEVTSATASATVSAAPNAWQRGQRQGVRSRGQSRYQGRRRPSFAVTATTTTTELPEQTEVIEQTEVTEAVTVVATEQAPAQTTPTPRTIRIRRKKLIHRKPRPDVAANETEATAEEETASEEASPLSRTRVQPPSSGGRRPFRRGLPAARRSRRFRGRQQEEDADAAQEEEQ